MRAEIKKGMTPRFTTMDKMEKGQLGRVALHSNLFPGELVLAIDSGIVVSLTASNHWSSGAALEVEILPPGTVIELTAE